MLHHQYDKRGQVSLNFETIPLLFEEPFTDHAFSSKSTMNEYGQKSAAGLYQTPRAVCMSDSFWDHLAAIQQKETMQLQPTEELFSPPFFRGLEDHIPGWTAISVHQGHKGFHETTSQRPYGLTK
jgi:hypothetical protein